MKVSFSSLILTLCLAIPYYMEANCGYMARFTIGTNWFSGDDQYLLGLPKGIVLPEYDYHIKFVKQVRPFSTKAPGIVVDGELSFAILYRFNQLFSIGPTISVGYSNSREQVQGWWDSVYLTESGVVKLGAITKVTDWLLIGAGARIATAGLEVNWSDEEKNTTYQTSLYDGFVFNTKAPLRDSTWSLGMYCEVGLMFPVTDQWKIVLIGSVFNYRDTEFRVRGARKPMGPWKRNHRREVWEYTVTRDDQSYHIARGHQKRGNTRAVTYTINGVTATEDEVCKLEERVPADRLVTLINRYGWRVAFGFVFEG